MLKSSSKGQIAQLRVELAAANKNYKVARPTIDCEYDLIIDDNKGNLLKAQIKFCNRMDRRKKNIELKLDNPRSKRLYYDCKTIDILLVYVPKVDRVLCFGKEFFHKKKSLRINLFNEESKYYWKKFKW